MGLWWMRRPGAALHLLGTSHPFPRGHKTGAERGARGARGAPPPPSRRAVFRPVQHGRPAPPAATAATPALVRLWSAADGDPLGDQWGTATAFTLEHIPQVRAGAANQRRPLRAQCGLIGRWARRHRPAVQRHFRLRGLAALRQVGGWIGPAPPRPLPDCPSCGWLLRCAVWPGHKSQCGNRCSVPIRKQGT